MFRFFSSHYLKEVIAATTTGNHSMSEEEKKTFTQKTGEVMKKIVDHTILVINPCCPESNYGTPILGERTWRQQSTRRE
jgi:hypothetical protein